MVPPVVVILFALFLVSLSPRRMTTTYQEATAGLVSLIPASASSSLSATEVLVQAIRKEEARFTQGTKKREKTCNASGGGGSNATDSSWKPERRLGDKEANESGARTQLYPVRLLVPDLVLGAQKHANLVQRLKKLVERSCGLIGSSGPFGGVKIELPSGTGDEEIAEIINAVQEEGLEAEPDYMVVLAGKVTPNDPLFSNQWGFQEVNLPAAWELETTAGLKQDARPIVCVSDSGVDYTHEDLYQNIYFNNAESLGIPDVDDDNNGYVDDIYGVNLWDVKKANNPMDERAHGTHVAGTLGAVGDNEKGVSGASWRPRIIPCKFIGEPGGSVSAAAECIAYCVKRGAKVSVHSYAFTGTTRTLLNSMIWAERLGLIMIFAGGNSGTDIGVSPSYPACYTRELTGALAVANLYRPGGALILSPQSNYGNCVQLGCPGTNILSTISKSKGGSYGTMCGTSMAAALMAGIVTLMAAVNPSLTPADCRRFVKMCIVRLPSLRNLVEWEGVPDARCCVRAAATGPASRSVPSWSSFGTATLGLVLAYLVGS